MPAHPGSFDRVADCYDATRAMPSDATASIAAGVRQALREVAATPSLLEIGIGTGRIAIPLATSDVRVTGIDIAPAMLARLRAKCPELPVAFADAAQLPFRSAVFDGALFVHVLHLVADAGAMLRAADRVVKPGGVLLHGRTDYADSPWRAVLGWVRNVAQELGAEMNSARWGAADRVFTDHARAVGAEVAETPLTSWTERASGRDLLRAIEGRVYSSTWAIPDAIMPELLQRLAVRVEEVLGGLDNTIENCATFTLTVARLPK